MPAAPSSCLHRGAHRLPAQPWDVFTSSQLCRKPAWLIYTTHHHIWVRHLLLVPCTISIADEHTCAMQQGTECHALLGALQWCNSKAANPSIDGCEWHQFSWKVTEFGCQHLDTLTELPFPIPASSLGLDLRPTMFCFTVGNQECF